MNWRIIILTVLAVPAFAQRFPHVQAHAHNDYEHSRPLFDALDNGFLSIEADIHLINGTILVSHDSTVDKLRTLEALYLRPLDSIARSNSGWIYPNYHQSLTLMIDIKTPAEETFIALRSALLKYEYLLATPRHQGPVKILISGNRTLLSLQQDNDQLMTIDGRPEDLDNKFASTLMPVVSEGYKKVTGEESSPVPSEQAIRRISDLARRVHDEQKKLRLWAIPDNEKSWQVLLDAGVDLISTDQLPQLHAFLIREQL